MELLPGDDRHAARVLLRAPSFTAVAILTLAFGLARLMRSLLHE